MEKNYLPSKSILKQISSMYGGTVFTLPEYEKKTVKRVSKIALATILRLAIPFIEKECIGIRVVDGRCSECETKIESLHNYCPGCGRHKGRQPIESILGGQNDE